MIARSARCAHTSRIASVEKYVRGVARRHVRRLPDGCAVDIDDLVNAGRLGAFIASTKFDPERGVKFLTYASWWIIQAIDREVKCGARTIRVPTRVLERVIADDDSLDDLDRLRSSWAGGIVRLDAAVGGNGTPDFLGKDLSEAVSVDDLLYEQQCAADVRRRVSALPERERRAVERRILDEAPLCQVAREIGLSGEGVRHVLFRALKRLRAGYQEQSK